MKIKYRIKKNPNSSLFSRLTGIDSTIVKNANNCLVVKKNTANGGISITTYAHVAYLNGLHDRKINPRIKSHTTCGILNCVQEGHIVSTYNPTQKESEYIQTYIKTDTDKSLAHSLNVPLPIFRQYLKNLRKSSK